MIKTQIQLPDELYYALKKVAEEREWSLAEALRRGAEYIVSTHPSDSCVNEEWKPPLVIGHKVANLTDDQLKRLAQEDDVETPLQKPVKAKARKVSQ